MARAAATAVAVVAAAVVPATATATATVLGKGFVLRCWRWRWWCCRRLCHRRCSVVFAVDVDEVDDDKTFAAARRPKSGTGFRGELSTEMRSSVFFFVAPWVSC